MTNTPSIERLKELLAKVTTPNPFDWHFPWRVVADGGKPTIVGARSGNLFRGYICTWDEAELIVATVNALPHLIATLETLTPSAGEAEREAVVQQALERAMDRMQEEMPERSPPWREVAEDEAGPFAVFRRVIDIFADELLGSRASLASPPLPHPDIEGRHCNRCAEDLAPTQMLCPFCENPSVPISEARSRPDITRELLTSKRPYAVFDYYSDVDGVPDQQNFMVSTLSPPQHPVALCGPDRKFADALCAMLNSLSLPTTEIRREAWQPIETAPHAVTVLACRFDDSFGEWIYAVVLSPPSHPFTHWQPLPRDPSKEEGRV